MIRREAGHDFLLITQADHAVVAQTLARHFGNAKFAKPMSRTTLAVAMHDAGWPLHDDQPTLNNRQHPLDVLEVPHAISLKVWAASADRAQAIDPYAGLLVSLHSLALSILNSSSPINKDETFDVKKMQDQFAVNKFQHAEIERQEKLRQLLAFNPDLPLKHGLAEPKASPQDDQLRFDFRLLQAMDLLSLCLCCTKPPQELTNDVLRNPSASPIRLKITKSLNGVLHVDPWPFDSKLIEIAVPCRRISGSRFESTEAFRDAYASAKIESLSVAIGM